MSDVWRFAQFTTFCGVPSVALEDLDAVDVVIIGAPIDWGASHRAGARFGPKAIREADYLDPDMRRPHLPTGIDPFEVMSVVDAGDVKVSPGYLERGLDTIADAVAAIATAGAVPIVLGGDHSVTYANGIGLACVLGDDSFGLIHFDAHADTGESAAFGALHGHGTPMRRLVESGAVPGHRFVQIGLRGYWPEPHVIAWMHDNSMKTYMMSEIVDRGLGPVVDDAVEACTSTGDGVFISVDIDVVDPGMAPGTGTPEPGGLLSRELLDTVRRLARELPVVGADVVEVAPPYDGPGQVTAFLANRVVLEILNGMAERRSGL
jgi:agmatinase